MLVDEKEEMSIKQVAEAVVEALDFKGEIIVTFFVKLFFTNELFTKS
jgi:hypothetical protein